MIHTQTWQLTIVQYLFLAKTIMTSQFELVILLISVYFSQHKRILGREYITPTSSIDRLKAS